MTPTGTSLGEVPSAGHPFRFTVIAHSDRTVLGPMSAERLTDLVARCSLDAGDHVLEIGSGKGRLLVELLTRWSGATAEGFDRNPWFVADARAAAIRVGVAERVSFVETDVPGALIGDRAAALAVGIGATGILGDQPATVTGLAGAARPGGMVVFGDGLWIREPPASGLAAFGMSRDEVAEGVDGFAALGVDAGLEVVDVEVVSQEEWDAYEDDYAGAVERWVSVHDEDPDAPAFLERATSFRSSYAEWRRDALGFAIARFRAPA